MSSNAKEKAAQIRKALAKKESSLIIKIMESDLYDWNPTARYLLVTLAFGQRTNEEAYVPEDMPDHFKTDMLGWCDMAQWRLMLRVGVSESQINRWIATFKEDKVIRYRSWIDDNNAVHAMYQINESVVAERQRSEQSADVERPKRYKKKRGANKGSFSATHQPKGKAAVAFAKMVMESDDL
jgi:hypothetical protein